MLCAKEFVGVCEHFPKLLNLERIICISRITCMLTWFTNDARYVRLPCGFTLSTRLTVEYTQTQTHGEKIETCGSRTKQ